MFQVFFDIQSIIMTEWVTSSQIVNKQYYKQVVEKLCEHVGKKGPELCKNVWNLQQDNVAAHNVLTVNQFMATKKDHCSK